MMPIDARHHDVRRLQVAMDDALVVGGSECLGERGGDRNDSLDRETVRRDHAIEGLAVHGLHGQEVDSLDLLDGVDRHDPGVIEGSQGLRLAAKALEALRPRCHGRRQHLESHLAS
jgi:hypothetical protein